MACAQPLLLNNPHYRHKNYVNSYKQYLEVPCGWCLNCRIDRQNWLCDALTYEYKKYNFKGAFVTFTYDDIHLQALSNVIADDFIIIPEDNGKINHRILFKDNKPIEFSLSKQHPKDFLKRLRSQIDYYYEKYSIQNCDDIRKDFKYFMSGEYGDIFGRPHYHFIFIGLDWFFCEDLLKDCWQNGLIDVRPIQSGAFEYVTKYLEKQCHSTLAEELYDNRGLVRPFSTHSLGLGKGIILDNLDYIMSHNGCYLTDNNLLRPIPRYYKDALHIRPTINHSNDRKNMKTLNIKYDDNTYGFARYSLKKINEFRHNQAILRHEKLQRSYESSGKIYTPLNSYYLTGDSIAKQIATEANLQSIPF